MELKELKFAAVIIVLLAALPLVFAPAFLPNKAAISYPYDFNASLGGSLKNTPCILIAKDEFNTTTKAWNIDEAEFPMQTDNNGYLLSYVIPDNAFVNNGNYTFTLACGNFRQSQLVTFEVGGSSEFNIFFLNSLDWINARPMEALLVGFGGALILVFLAFVIKGISGKKTLW